MENIEPSRELLTVEQFLTLSAKINYQLSARALNKPALLSLVLGSDSFEGSEREALLLAFDLLQAGYQGDRRRVGTPGILHPLRTAAILARSMTRPSILHVLSALLHDKDEDLTAPVIGEERWRIVEGLHAALLEKLDEQDRGELERRIDLLSARTSETYQEYLARVIDSAREMPDLVHVKLADRIDNTFDVNLQHPGVTRFNFFRAVFDILFMPGFRGVTMGRFHFMPDEEEGVMLLGQLFKDVFFLALLRHEGLDATDHTTRRLFEGLAVAGIREAQWLILEMFNTCIRGVEEQRAILRSVMQYCSEGGAAAITSRDSGHELDGVLLESYMASREGHRKEMLTRLFQNRELLAKLVLTFIVVFASFINDPAYTLRGIETLGQPH
jgi:hypothetical protein